MSVEGVESKKKGTILAVDDAEISVDILVGILKKYDVIPALNAKDALEILEEEEVELILLDIIMPDIDGYELCKIIKANPKLKKIPLIFITAKTTEEDIKKGFELGALDYVTKPFNPTELLSRVSTHIELYNYQNNLEKKVKEEIEKSKLRDQILNQQSKQAALGELLMHIAHQWKQPLTELSALNMLNISLVKNDEYTKDDLLESFHKSDGVIKFMTDTVTTFQNFYKPSDIISSLNVYDVIKQSCALIDATFNFHQIDIVINKICDVEIYAKENEYAQVILNILNNAKDVFINNKTKNAKVVIDIDKEGDRSKVTISDNGGGIKNEMLDLIFDVFSTNKDSTGFGLHMSKSIIEKSGGTISAENTNSGAKFTIII